MAGLEGGHNLTFQVWINRDVLAIKSENAPISPISKQSSGFSEANMGGETWRTYSAQSGDGLIRVHVADRADARGTYTSKIVWRTMIPMFIGLPLLETTVWFGVGIGTTPLQRIAGEIAQWKPNRIKPIDETHIPVEALPLTRAVKQHIWPTKGRIRHRTTLYLRRCARIAYATGRAKNTRRSRTLRTDQRRT